jgi:hypothetical protein
VAMAAPWEDLQRRLLEELLVHCHSEECLVLPFRLSARLMTKTMKDRDHHDVQRVVDPPSQRVRAHPCSILVMT